MKKYLPYIVAVCALAVAGVLAFVGYRVWGAPSAATLSAGAADVIAQAAVFKDPGAWKAWLSTGASTGAQYVDVQDAYSALSGDDQLAVRLAAGLTS